MFAVGETPAQLQHFEEASGGLARCVGRTININITVEHQLLIMMNNCSRQVIVLSHAIFSFFFFLWNFHCSLIPRLPPFFALRVVFSNSVYYTEHKPKNKKRGRSGNKATSTLHVCELNREQSSKASVGWHSFHPGNRKLQEPTAAMQWCSSPVLLTVQHLC